jgi:hypothetical protein
MHAIDKIFRPSDTLDKACRKEPISVSKLDKQDAAWQGLKCCLGWDYAAHSKNLLVASHRHEKATASLTDALSQKRASLQSWQSLIGQLRSLVPGIPGSEGQFSLLQEALVTRNEGRIKIDATVREQLRTFQDLLADDRPAHIKELIPGDPARIGACDAAKTGMGGVWFTHEGKALLWGQPFADDIQKRLVSYKSYKNPRGDITNSDLELAGTVIHQHVLGQHASVTGETAYTLCNNMPAVSWQAKAGSTTTGKSAAYLLRLGAFVQKEQRCNHKINHISGEDNRMADDASQLWTLSDSQLLNYFNSTYPQTHSWQLCPPTEQVSSAVISSLSRKVSQRESAHLAWRQPNCSGRSGASSAPLLIPTPDSVSSGIPFQSSSFLPGASATVASHPLGTRSALEQRRMPYARWARRSPHWGPRTRA